jgi:hypothetical protein
MMWKKKITMERERMKEAQRTRMIMAMMKAREKEMEEEMIQEIPAVVVEEGEDDADE